MWPCSRPTRSLGGCAGYFDRDPFVFDAGATALMGLGRGEPIGDLMDVVGLDLESEPTPSYRIHLPDRRLDIVPDTSAVRGGHSRRLPRSSPISAGVLAASSLGRRTIVQGRQPGSAAAGPIAPRPGARPPQPWRARLAGGCDRRVDGPGRPSIAQPATRSVVPLDDRHATPGYRAGRAGNGAVRERGGMPPGVPPGDATASRRHAGPGRGPGGTVRGSRG